MVALVGPNGSGKTTLLKALGGELTPVRGAVRVARQNVRGLPARQLARHIAMVPQYTDPELAFSVEQLVSMGRTPYATLLGSATAADRLAIDAALRATDTGRLSARPFRELSGGEQQRVVLAMALAQETPFLLLDEPTVHLDLQHQQGLMELLRGLRHDRGMGVLAVVHDLNLAALYCDRMALLAAGHLIADGVPADILRQPGCLSVFGAALAVVDHPRTGVPQVLLDRN
jgi:iron complex transport system ATP-binding protein